MNLSDVNFWDLAALFFFSMASAGFVIFSIKYPRGSEVRLWGIRCCHLFGFTGVLFLRLSQGQLNEVTLLILSSLVVSLLAFEISSHFLKTG